MFRFIKFMIWTLVVTAGLSAQVDLIGIGSRDAGTARKEVVQSTRGSTPGMVAQPPVNGEDIETQFGLDSKGNRVFGAKLFQGSFHTESFTGFNPHYQISVGDEIQLLLWGALRVDVLLRVDPKGNIFIPEVGPVRVQGVRNDDLNEVIRQKIKTVYTQTVESYANLVTTQEVKVFVSGFVRRPGLYNGFAADSILYFLDKAGGIDLDRGSFIDIRIMRNNQVIHRSNLYNFLLDGEVVSSQFSDGDLILVGPLQNTVLVDGVVNNAFRFEFAGEALPLEQLLRFAQPQPDATHISIARRLGGRAEAFYYPLDTDKTINLLPLDNVSFTKSLNTETILVNLTGEQIGPKQVVVPYGARLEDVLKTVVPGPRSNMGAVQLFRESVADRQKELIQKSLENLERTMLNARSNSLEEAQLRLAEAQLVQGFIERAKTVVPKGQVLLGSDPIQRNVYLENNDIVYIPPLTNLVTVHGEAVFPSTMTWAQGRTIIDYINMAGGFTENADPNQILLVKADGSIINLRLVHRSVASVQPEPGDEVLILPKPDRKYLQFAKDISTILYQIAIAARVAVGI